MKRESKATHPQRHDFTMKGRSQSEMPMAGAKVNDALRPRVVETARMLPSGSDSSEDRLPQTERSGMSRGRAGAECRRAVS